MYPLVLKNINDNMGGIDFYDRITISYYRIKTRTNKLTLRTVLHFINLAFINSYCTNNI